MSKLKRKNMSVPLSIELLFDNEKLDLIKTMGLLYACFLQNKKKYRKISELVFYYSLVNFDLIKLFETGEENRSKISPNLYFRFQNKINQILLNLSDLNFIEIKGNLSFKTGDLAAKLTKGGLEFYEEMDSEYFSKLVEDYIYAMNQVDYTANNLKVLRGIS
ncbi:hypothetical protein P4493_13175 [Bacillus thuringiensis]|uniref:Uncharacterized protein n=5 Tax=Bacillus cereus group TaxID=86661 RepID=A0A6I7EHW3_BACCE|nr:MULTISPECIES: hypothetical protein [Bacillus]EAO56561.1 hypothetical protein RBTH_07016 [Bacillus thuringiensis serovar israelensis ATCC 35646]MED1151971.1 hypothetical protein [Bacillus paranthracis]AFQ29202.1 hypothetical protein BTF1_25195 [Bacillus thuringiensis HD-789]AJH07215.1 hypothetical protein AS86_4166 [Bacillus thuringiensis HD1002]AJI11289.1 hypothetical protein AK40_3993 [Bacillus cereus 03BB108]